MNANELREFQRLVSLYCDGVLDQPGLDQLSRMLADNPDAMETYIELTTTHSDLMLWGSMPASVDHGGSTTGTANGSVAHVPDTLTGQPLGGAQSTIHSWLPLGLAGLAASLLVMMVMTFYVFDASDRRVDSGSSGSSASDDTSVAQIIRKVDCDWENDRWAIVASSGVEAGQTLSISRGLMELKFKSGAIVTLEAPVAFTVESAMRGVLSHGKLTAEVPESAHGFTVSTPGGEAIDLGTSFGLFVGEDGVTETHVFKGEVVVRPSGAENLDKQRHLTDDMALRTGGERWQPYSLVAVPARFTRFGFGEGKSLPAPAVDRKLSLWLSADQRLQKDEKDRVSSWGDLCTTSNETAQDVWQVDADKRPHWIENAIGDKPAVRFNVKNVLVTEPIKLGASQSVCAVFSVNKRLVEKKGVSEIGRQLINMNGPPSLILAIDKNLRLVSRNYAGPRRGKDDRKNHVTVGKMKMPKQLDEKPVVVISVYDPAINQSRLYVDGVMVAVSTAPKLDATDSPRYIGAHPFLPNSHFFGDIAELMIFDTGLTEEEASVLAKSLMTKYQISATKTSIEKPKNGL